MNAFIPSFFKHKRPSDLVRIGRPYDGGYTITEKDIKKTGYLISLGIDDDWSFEEHFKKKTGAKIVCFDNNVNYKFWIKRFLKNLIYFDFRKNYYEQFKRVYV